jgi:hypothetical protein
MTPNDRLLAAIKARQQKQTEFGYGIITADKYVRTLLDCLGSDRCYHFAANKHTSFDDVLMKAAGTLVYSNPEMELSQIDVSKRASVTALSDVELPKNTLMVFQHTLTSSRKDRDGDILRTEGAEVDPRMLLLWQHVHTLPIGKMITVANRNSKKLSLISAIVDMNELSHDAAVMVDNDMARFSHGFRAIEFEEPKATEGSTDEMTGFDVKKFEVMEESMVSVPANVDANTEEVLMSLLDGGKLTSPLMKEYGRAIKNHRPAKVPGVTIKYRQELGDLGEMELTCNSLTQLNAAADAGFIGGKENEDKSRTGGRKGEEEEGKDSTSKETDEGTAEEKESAPDSQVKDAINESWEWISQKLRGQAKGYLKSRGVSISENEWVWLVGTFPDHAVICCESYECGGDDEFRYFKTAWKMEKKEPKFTGDPESINVVTTTEIRKSSPSYESKLEGEEEDDVKTQNDEKAGRAISKANEGKIIDAKESVDEAIKVEGTPKACKALLREASGNLGSVLSALGSGDSEESVDRIDVKDAMAIVLALANEHQRKLMLESLKGFEEAKERSKFVKRFHALKGC